MGEGSCVYGPSWWKLGVREGHPVSRETKTHLQKLGKEEPTRRLGIFLNLRHY